MEADDWVWQPLKGKAKRGEEEEKNSGFLRIRNTLYLLRNLSKNLCHTFQKFEY